MLEPESDKPEEVLKTLLEQKDYRFLEGFPVVFVNALRAKDQLEWETSDWSPNFYSKRAKTLLPHLLAFTLLLFKFYKVGETFERRTSKLLSKFRSGKKVFRNVSQSFSESDSVRFDGFEFSPERLKNTFQTYAFQPVKKPELERKKQALEQELLLAQMFTVRQKALLKKKLDNQPFTKTEREYFSRVVKKRLQALADDELHQMARELVVK